VLRRIAQERVATIEGAGSRRSASLPLKSRSARERVPTIGAQERVPPTSAACGGRGRRAGGSLVRSYNGDNSKADGDTPNKQRLRDSEGAQMRQMGGGPLNQRSKRRIQKPPGAEGGTVA